VRPEAAERYPGHFGPTAKGGAKKAAGKRLYARKASAKQAGASFLFDRRYEKLFHALVLTIHECGFLSRRALER